VSILSSLSWQNFRNYRRTWITEFIWLNYVRKTYIRNIFVKLYINISNLFLQAADNLNLFFSQLFCLALRTRMYQYTYIIQGGTSREHVGETNFLITIFIDRLGFIRLLISLRSLFLIQNIGISLLNLCLCCLSL
jgi:hypothetical protein